MCGCRKEALEAANKADQATLLLQRLQSKEQAVQQNAENLRQQDAALKVTSLCGCSMQRD